MKKLMLGNEAVARGAYEARVNVVSSYPGTPSTEITENIAKYDEVYSEWGAEREGRARVSIGASFAGARAMSCMKHVGVNVAADPLFTVSYTGVNGGLVICAADDQGCIRRRTSRIRGILPLRQRRQCLSRRTARSVKDFTKLAFDISESTIRR